MNWLQVYWSLAIVLAKASGKYTGDIIATHLFRNGSFFLRVLAVCPFSARDLIQYAKIDGMPRREESYKGRTS